MTIGAPVNLGDILRLPALGDRPAYLDLGRAEGPDKLGGREIGAVEITAVELDRRIVALARGLKRRGFTVGDRVGILAENRVEFILAYLGAMRMGAVAVPINFKLPATTIAHIFKDSDTRFAFVDAGRAAHVPSGVDTVSFDARGGADFGEFLDPGAMPTFEPGEQDLAEILYTSGSTGLPKGVPLGHQGQLWALSNYAEPLETAVAPQRTLVVAPLYHMNGLFFSTVALTNRIAIVSLPRFEARRYLQTVAEQRCTVLSGIPTMFAMMLREHDLIARLDLSSVRQIFIGSAPLTDALLTRVLRLFPNAQSSNGYGTTEAGPSVFGPHPRGLPRPAVSLGYPWPTIEWQLQQPGRTGADGGEEQGVLALRTPALMTGYLNLPRESASKIRDGWYSTGDIMRRDADGFFYFVGRADDMFNCGGENIYPGEVEKLLERHPAVAQALVVPAPDDIKGQIPVAFIVPRIGTEVSAEAIKRYALEHGPAYAHPRFVQFCDQLPLSGTHKIDRAALVAEAARWSRGAGRS